MLDETFSATQEGVYHCRATVTQGTLRSPDYTVTLFDTPAFIQHSPANSSTLLLPFGWSVVLPCVSNLQSYLSVSWWFNGSLLTSHRGQYISYSGNLNIYSAGFNFSGSYRCTVVNRMTQENFTGPLIYLSVTTIQLPVNNTIDPIQAPDVVNVDPGGMVNLEYNRYYDPIYNITWGPLVTSLPSMSPNLTNILNTSNYTAVVFINELQSLNVTIQVRINTSPSVQMNVSDLHYICPSDRLTLLCTVSNTHPYPTHITWFYNGNSVSVGNYYLPISSAQLGYYQCYVEIGVTASSDSTLLQTFPTPRIRIQESTPLHLTFGSPLSLTCEDINSTNATWTRFKWTHGAVELSENSTLSISYTTPDMTGEYTCIAYACPLDNATFSISVNVSGPEIRITQLPREPNSVSITWPFHPTAPQHELESRRGDSPNWCRVATTDQLFFTPTNLQLGIRYTYRILYFRGAERIQISTSESFQLEVAPVITLAIPLSPTQFLIRWTWSGELSSLDSFVIIYELNGGETSNHTVLISQLDTSNSYFDRVISGLDPNSEYGVFVYGVKNIRDVWDTPYSSAKNVSTTPNRLTVSPTNVSVSHLPSNNSIFISYSLLTNVSAEYGDILGYKIFVYLENNPFNGDFYIQSPHESYLTFTHFPGVELYYVVVLAFTIAGDGPEAGQSLFLSNTNRTNSTTNSTGFTATTGATVISIATTVTSTAFRMTALPATNATVQAAPSFIHYLPYIIALPAVCCLTCAAVLVVLVGKCIHMHYWKSVRDEADGYRMRRYEAQFAKHKNNHDTSTDNVKLQSVIKSASPTRPSRDISLEPRSRMRTYQVPIASEETGDFHSSTESLSQPGGQTSGRPLTPDSGKVLDTFSDDLDSNSSPHHNRGNFSFPLQPKIDSAPFMQTTKTQNPRSDATHPSRVRTHEFSV